MHINNFKPDDFLRISYEPYIARKDSTNLLNSILIDEASRVNVSKLFVESIHNKGIQCLSTEFHLKWAMECIGYSFAMPIEELDVIYKAVKIYKNWLLVPANSPIFLMQSFGSYQREILGHYSLAFSQKKDVAKHAELCIEVLGIIRAFIRASPLETETWEYLIQLLLLVADQIFSNYSKLTEEISSKLLILIIEVVIRSNTRNTLLWRKMQKRISSWVDHKIVINYWGITTLSFTNSLASIIYICNTSVLEINFAKDSKNSEDAIRMTLCYEQIVYYWYMLLQMFLNETKANAKMIPDLHFALVKSIGKIIDAFLLVASKRSAPGPLPAPATLMPTTSEGLNQCVRSFQTSHFNYNTGLARLPIPSINELLDIFGQWLFYHSAVDSTYDVFGKIEAINTLCRVFSLCQSPASPEFVSHFLNILLENIAKGDPRIIGEILKNSTDLLSIGVNAIDFLLRPDGFIQHLELYLCEKDTEISIRLACYKILASIVSLLNVYKLHQLGKHVRVILTEALVIESDGECFFILIWSLCIFAATGHEDKKLVKGMVTGVLDRITQVDYKANKRIYCDLLEVVAVLPFLVNRNSIDKKFVVSSIKKLYKIVPRAGKSGEDDQTLGLLMAINNWIYCFPCVIEDPEVRTEVLKVAENRISSDINKGEGESLLASILNSIDKPLKSHSCHNHLSSPQTPFKHYLYSNTLLSFSSHEPETTLLLRNTSGIYRWTLNLCLSNKPKERSLNLRTDSKKKQKPFSPPPIPKISESLHSSLTIQEQQIFKVLSSYYSCQSLLSCEPPSKCASAEISTHHFFHSTKTSLSKKARSLQSAKSSATHRVFLSHLGLIESNEIYSLSVSTANQLIKSLDSVREKETIVYPVFYLQTPEDKEFEVTKSARVYTREFKEVLEKLGCLASGETAGLTQLQRWVKEYEKVMYQDLRLFEAVVVCPALGGKCKKFAKMVVRFPVIVMWNQRINDSYSKKQPNLLGMIDLKNSVVIILTVVTQKLVRVNVHGGRIKTGPLLDNMIIPNVILPRLLQFTIYNYHTSQKSYFQPWVSRKKLLCDKTLSKDALYSLLNNLF